MIAAATYSENLTISKSLKIVGSNKRRTIIGGGGTNTVVNIPNSAAHVTLSGLTIRNGFARGGGGIYSSGMLTINNSTISGNTVRTENFTPFSSSEGAGIYSSGMLTINNTTISGNSAFAAYCHLAPCGAFGGGIFNLGGVAINNSTLSVSGNAANGVGPGFARGGGIAGPATLQNSIVANNSGGNCSGTMISNGYNMSSDATCTFSNHGDRNNIDPKLGPLQYNGGPTQTMALPSGSPAIDAGNPSGCTDGQGHVLKTDQRGLPRPDSEDKTGCDMGAYERQSD
jgi:hypothetical protein